MKSPGLAGLVGLGLVTGGVVTTGGFGRVGLGLVATGGVVVPGLGTGIGMEGLAGGLGRVETGGCVGVVGFGKVETGGCVGVVGLVAMTLLSDRSFVR